MQATAAQREINAILNAIEIGVYGIDAAGRCTFINKAALDMLGFAQEEVLGANMHALIHHTYPDGTPYPEPACPLLQTLETGLVDERAAAGRVHAVEADLDRIEDRGDLARVGGGLHDGV